MCTHMHTHTQTHAHTLMYTHHRNTLHTHKYTHEHTHVYTHNVHTGTHTQTRYTAHTYTYTCTHTRTYTHTCNYCVYEYFEGEAILWISTILITNSISAKVLCSMTSLLLWESYWLYITVIQLHWMQFFKKPKTFHPCGIVFQHHTITYLVFLDRLGLVSQSWS